MTISSMTGYARRTGELDGLQWSWEIKSVNGKSLDLRCRLPMGYEGLEPQLRAAAAAVLKRGNLQVQLAVTEAGRGEDVRLNRDVLEQVIAAGESLRARIGGDALRADQLLGLRGVLDVTSPAIDEAAVERRQAALVDGFSQAVAALDAARRDEGSRLFEVLSGQLDRIAELVRAARDNPSRSVEAIRARLAELIGRLLEAGAGLDPDRLHQEAVILATRSDIQEELDRLESHLAAARKLLGSGEAIGRKFDFLAQEFNREANTLCSKAVDRSITAIGLDLKTVIDQMREQVQNIE